MESSDFGVFPFTLINDFPICIVICGENGGGTVSCHTSEMGTSVKEHPEVSIPGSGYHQSTNRYR